MLSWNLGSAAIPPPCATPPPRISWLLIPKILLSNLSWPWWQALWLFITHDKVSNLLYDSWNDEWILPSNNLTRYYKSTFVQQLIKKTTNSRCYVKWKQTYFFWIYFICSHTSSLRILGHSFLYFTQRLNKCNSDLQSWLRVCWDTMGKVFITY